MRVVGSLATKYAPPYSLILHYFLSGIVFDALGVLSLLLFQSRFAQPFYTFKYAAIAHLFLLGFVLMVIFGALYQLIPVALEIPIFSFKIGYIQFYFFLTGILIFIHSLLNVKFFTLLPIGASLIYISILLFTLNFFISLKNLEVKNTTAKFIITAVVSLFIGGTLGLILSLNFVLGFYPKIVNLILAHITFTLFGFVMMVVMGVSMVLFPMFTLAHKFNDKYIKAAFITSIVTIFIGGTLIAISDSLSTVILTLMLAFLSLALYITQITEIYRKRPRKTKDVGIDTMFISHTFLMAALVLFVLSIFFKSLVFAAFTTFIGFLNTLIFGSLYKIVPFLTWFHKFSSLVGKRKVPMLTDMLPRKLPSYQIALFLLGITLYSIYQAFNSPRFISTISIAFMFVGVLLFLYITIYTLTFKLEE